MRVRNFIHLLLVPTPSWLKVFLYRNLFKYRIEPGVRIGMSIIRVDDCFIGAGTRIGHFNYISSIKRLHIGSNAIIGVFNILLGGESVEIGDEAQIGRFNEINSIINPVSTGGSDPRLIVGKGAVITAWHKIDYTDRIIIGDSTIIAGRHSCLWTHNRQQVMPIEIGRNCYVGSGVQMVPGSTLGSYCVVGLGAVITKKFDADSSLIAGVPARVVKPLDEAARTLVEFPTRPDLAGVAGASDLHG